MKPSLGWALITEYQHLAAFVSADLSADTCRPVSTSATWSSVVISGPARELAELHTRHARGRRVSACGSLAGERARRCARDGERAFSSPKRCIQVLPWYFPLATSTPVRSRSVSAIRTIPTDGSGAAVSIRDRSRGEFLVRHCHHLRASARRLREGMAALKRSN
jgi:hypothetical protein